MNHNTIKIGVIRIYTHQTLIWLVGIGSTMLWIFLCGCSEKSMVPQATSVISATVTSIPSIENQIVGTATIVNSESIDPPDEEDAELSTRDSSNLELETENFTLKPVIDIDPELLELHLSYATGGADSFYNYGLECEMPVNRETASVYIGGVFSTKDQYQHGVFWQDKYTTCKDKDRLELGDMVYFVATGFAHGENITFTLNGPQGKEEYFTTVYSQTVFDGSGRVAIEDFEVARFSWVASPDLGVGKYNLTVAGSSKTIFLEFTVFESAGSNFGIRFQPYDRPLTFSQDEAAELVLVGFDPGQTIKILLIKDPIPVVDSISLFVDQTEFDNFNSQIVGFLEAEVNSSGYLIEHFEWPATLSPGLYSFFIPEMGDFPLYGIQFAVLGEPGAPNSDQGTSTPEPVPQLYRVIGVESDDVLYVRDGPGVDNEEIGVIPPNGSDIQITGVGVNVEGSIWVPISYENINGWVNSSFLAVQQSSP